MLEARAAGSQGLVKFGGRSRRAILTKPRKGLPDSGSVNSPTQSYERGQGEDKDATSLLG